MRAVPPCPFHLHGRVIMTSITRSILTMSSHLWRCVRSILVYTLPNRQFSSKVPKGAGVARSKFPFPYHIQDLGLLLEDHGTRQSGIVASFR